MRKFVEPDVADNPLYHDTWKLLKKYRDVVWSLELSVQHVRTKFEIVDTEPSSVISILTPVCSMMALMVFPL